jgi:hypothetical protein
MTPEVSIRDLRNARADGLGIFTVHYACESWFEVKDRPSGVSCISLADVAGGGDVTFSVTDRKEEGELYVLRSFYDFLRQHADARLLTTATSPIPGGSSETCPRSAMA